MIIYLFNFTYMDRNMIDLFMRLYLDITYH